MNRMKDIKLPASALRCLLTVCLYIQAAVLMAQQAEQPLRGRVLDEKQQPIAGAVVNIAEENRIAVTGKDGYFKLKNVSDGDEIYVTASGYKDKTQAANLDGSFIVVLTKSDALKEELLATPFAYTKSKYVLNSMSTVSGRDLERHPVTVLQNAFAGTLSGVATLELNSEPGWSESELYVRGLRTLNPAARRPLIMVDNVERDLSFLDAYPIETVSVIKDAAATAIYGLRGANGVILVTTRRGSTGKTRISVNQEFGFQALSGIPRQQNAYNYVMTMNQARYLDGLRPLYTAEDVQHYKEATDGSLDPSLRFKYANTDWYDVMLRDLAPQNRTNLTLSGGNRSTRYFVSFTYLRQEGMYNSQWTELNDAYSTQHRLNRFNLRSNIDMDVTRFLNVSLDLGGRIDQITQPLSSTWTLFTWGAGENLPINPVFAPNGKFFLPNDNDSKNAAGLLAGTGIDYNRRRNLYSNVKVTGNLDFITKGLKAQVMVGFDAYNTFEYRQSQNFDGFYYDRNSGSADDAASFTYVRKRTASPLSNPTNVARDMSYNINTWASLNYDREFGRHELSAQAMMRTYQNVLEGYTSSNRYLTYGGIASYVFDKRYIAQFNAAYMGSDNYEKGNRFGFFPGVSLGWLLSEEQWLKGSSLSMLKLRASLGRSGQSVTGVRRYPYQGEYTVGGGYNFGTSQAYQQGTYESAAGNSNIRWELSDMLNLGLDFDISNRKLYGQVDVFKERRSNILISRSTVPDMFGMAVPQDSYGKAESRGLELTLGHRSKIGGLGYFVEGMLTYNKSKLTEIDEINPLESYQARTERHIPYNNEDGLYYIKDKWASDASLISTSQADASLNSEKYPYQGNVKLGNAIFIDQNGDGQITTNDRVPYGYTRVPELVPSLSFGFDWKGFDTRVMLTAFLNRTVELRENMDYAFGWGGATTHEVTKTWGYFTDDPADPRNTGALYPRLSTTFADNDRNYPRNQSNIWFRNGNFLSLRNVEVGYSLPAKLISKINLSQCRFYARGYNLYNWSEFSNGFDPESPLNYLWAYPKTRSFSFGINVAL